MVRSNQISPARTGFLATLVLSCAFAILASALWGPRNQTKTALAADAAGVVPAVAAPTVADTR